MNCTEPVAPACIDVTDQTVVTSNQASAVALEFTQPKNRGSVYLRAKGGP